MSPALRRYVKWRDAVGCGTPRIETRSPTHNSPELSKCRMRSRVGSASARNRAGARSTIFRESDMILVDVARRSEMKSTGQEPLRILFVSTGDAARSQIAASILRKMSQGRATIVSAGITPQREINGMSEIAVRNVLNARIVNERPKRVDSVLDETFDYVFTLTTTATKNVPAFRNRPKLIRWRIEDPTTVGGTRAQRQVAFDKVARELLKRLRPWWRARDAETRPAPPPPATASRRRPWLQARWRTTPAVTDPIVLVVYQDAQRHCINMCGFLERSGFQVFCGNEFSAPHNIQFLPDVVVLRVDGDRVEGTIRQNFRLLRTFQTTFPETPLLLAVDHTLSDEEGLFLETIDVPVFQRLRKNNSHLVKAIGDLISQRRS